MPILSWRDAAGAPRETQFEDEVSIGRDVGEPPQPGVIALADPRVSRHHARVEKTFRGYELSDAGSRNGTRINGAPLQGYHVMHDGDVIGVGGTMVTYRAERVRGVTIVGEDVTASGISRLVQRSGKTGFLRAEEITSIDELRRDYERLRIAHELSMAISSEVSLQQILERVLREAIAMFRAERGLILLHNAMNGEFEPACVRTNNGASEDQEIKVSRTILREVIDERTAVISSDAMVDSRFNAAHSIVMQGIKSTMSVPLLADDELLGVLHLDSSIKSTIFTEKDLQLLSSFAMQAARAIRYSQLVEQKEEETVTRDRLSRLLPASIVDQVLSGNADLVRGGDVRDATVLFCDIRGFTSMSEQAAPQQVVEILNEYFELMVEQVFAFDGALDKFIGDEIMAVWGAHVPLEDHAYKAVQAAVGMQKAIASLNALRERRGQPAIQAGVGINSGELVAGYMGSSRAMNYTVIGDIVNVAARLCSAAAPDEIVISGKVAERLSGRVPIEALPHRPLKGKSEVVELFRVMRH